MSRYAPGPFLWSLVRRCSAGCRVPAPPVDTIANDSEESLHPGVCPVTIVAKSLISLASFRRSLVAARN